MLHLQTAAGNQAVASMLDKRPDSGIVVAAHRLAQILLASAAHTEELYRHLLHHASRRVELEAAFEAEVHRPLRDVISERLSETDRLRAIAYLDHGGLRLADKIYLAMKGAGTSTATLRWLLKEAGGPARAAVDRDFKASYGDEYGDAQLPDATKTPSRIAGALFREFSWEPSWADAIECNALLAFGEIRPIDEVQIAIEGPGTDVTRLFAALARIPDPEEAKRLYAASYGGDLQARLTSRVTGELSFNDRDRAVNYFERKLDLPKTVELLIGTTATDEAAIFAGIAAADETEKKQLREQLADPASAVAKAYNSWSSGLDAGDRRRIEALLGPRQHAPAALRQLHAEGGVDRNSVYETIKRAQYESWKLYRAGFHDRQSEFRRFVDENTTATEEANLHLILSDGADSFQKRAGWALSGLADDEEYFFHLLEHFTREATHNSADPGKRDLLADGRLESLMAGRLTPAERARARALLRPPDLSPEEAAAWLDREIREHSGLGSAVSHTGVALADENRELQAGLVRALSDGSMTREERATLETMQRRTDVALKAYVAARDELEGYAVTAITTAAWLLATPLTGGASLAAAMAKAALLSAMTRFVAERLVKGARFDPLSDEAMAAFVGGAADGVMAALGPLAAERMVGPLLDSARGAATRSSLVVRKALIGAIDGGVSGAVSGVAETALKDETWREGTLRGIERVGLDALMSAASGAAVSGVLGAVDPVSGSQTSVPKLKGLGAKGPPTHPQGNNSNKGMGLPPLVAPRAPHVVDSGLPGLTAEQAHRLHAFFGAEHTAALGGLQEAELRRFAEAIERLEPTRGDPVAVRGLERLRSGRGPKSLADFLSAVPPANLHVYLRTIGRADFPSVRGDHLKDLAGSRGELAFIAEYGATAWNALRKDRMLDLVMRKVAVLDPATAHSVVASVVAAPTRAKKKIALGVDLIPPRRVSAAAKPKKNDPGWGEHLRKAKEFAESHEGLKDRRGKPFAATAEAIEILATMYQICERAHQPRMQAQRTHAQRVRLLEDFDTLGRRAGLQTTWINALRGNLSESLFVPKPLRGRKRRIPHPEKGYSILDYCFEPGRRPGSTTGRREWVEQKSDLIDGSSGIDAPFAPAVARARRYVVDAKLDLEALRSGPDTANDELVIEFVRTPANEATRSAMLAELFGPGSPFVAVRFGEGPWIERPASTGR